MSVISDDKTDIISKETNIHQNQQDMKYSLFFLSVFIPMALLLFGVKVMNSPFWAAFTFFMMLCELVYARRQFCGIGRGYNIDLTDAFWLSTCVNAVLSLVFLLAHAGYGWRFVEGFSEMPYAFAPLAAAFAYCCVLGAIICVIRLIKNNWVGKTAKVQTWCFLILALALIACTFFAIGNMYFGLGISENFLNANYALIWVCALGITACGYRLTVLHKD